MQRCVEDIQNQCKEIGCAHETKFTEDQAYRMDFYVAMKVVRVVDLVKLSRQDIDTCPCLDALSKNWVQWLRGQFLDLPDWVPGEIPREGWDYKKARNKQSPLAQGYHKRGEEIRQLKRHVDELKVDVRLLRSEGTDWERKCRERAGMIRALEARVSEINEERNDLSIEIGRLSQRQDNLPQVIAGLRDRSLDELSLEDLYNAAEHAGALATRLTETAEAMRVDMERREAEKRADMKRCEANEKKLVKKRKAAEINTEIPDGFKCPISLNLMTDPVMVATGITYEREEIAQWLKTKKTCPFTQNILESKNLVPNHNLRKSIEDFVTRQVVSEDDGGL